MRARSIELPADITATNGWPHTAQTNGRAGAGVARGLFNNCLVRQQLSGRPRRLEDGKRDAILLGVTGV